MALIDSMLGAVLALILVLIAGGTLAVGLAAAAVAGVVVFVALAAATYRYYSGVQKRLTVAFPSADEAGRHAL